MVGRHPPFHTPVFVLTHHLRPAVQMNGGTTFDFLDASPAQALAQARQAAAGGDVRIGGGPATIREFLAAGLIDYAHIVVVPIVLGRGERLWDGLEGLEERFQIEAVNSPSGVTHITLAGGNSGQHGRAAGGAPAKAVQHLMIVRSGRSGRRRESAGQRRCWHGRPSTSWSN